MAATTLGWEWPTFMTPMPPAKSMSSRPSTSIITAPRASLMKAGVAWDAPFGTWRSRSAWYSACLDMSASPRRWVERAEKAAIVPTQQERRGCANPGSARVTRPPGGPRKGRRSVAPFMHLCLIDAILHDRLMASQDPPRYQELTRVHDAIIDSLADGLWICDGEANVLRINQASERLNAIEAVQVVGRNMKDLIAAGVFDRSATLEVIRTRAPVNMLQSRKGRKLVLTGTPVFDDAGALIRVVVYERDVTELDALQRELEQQEAIKDRFRNQMLEMQLEEIESRRVIAKSPCMQKALRQAIKVSAVDSTVLILGESGVGKGVFADLIHKYSSRSEKPLVKINCGAIPESLVEAELFGYDKGAFTGAQAKGKPGYFELADGGILFLDEIAELPLSSQVKLLRFLEDGRVMRVGGTQSRKLDVRIVAATHRDLHAMVDQGAFRLDLYYRLSVIPLHVPSLRERTECILPLLRHYLELLGERLGVRRRFSRAATEALLAYPWPGNVRELMNLCERLVVMSTPSSSTSPTCRATWSTAPGRRGPCRGGGTRSSRCPRPWRAPSGRCCSRRVSGTATRPPWPGHSEWTSPPSPGR